MVKDICQYCEGLFNFANLDSEIDKNHVADL